MHQNGRQAECGEHGVNGCPGDDPEYRHHPSRLPLGNRSAEYVQRIASRSYIQQQTGQHKNPISVNSQHTAHSIQFIIEIPG
ncbi:hypothetical protein D3C87_2075840 [compost metagenome]